MSYPKPLIPRNHQLLSFSLSWGTFSFDFLVQALLLFCLDFLFEGFFLAFLVFFSFFWFGCFLGFWVFFGSRSYSQEKWQSQVTFGKNLKWSCFLNAIYYNSPTAMGFVLLCPHPELWLLFQHTFVILYPWAEELKPLVHQNSLRQLEQWFLRHIHPSWITSSQLANFLMCKCWMGQEGERRN